MKKSLPFVGTLVVSVYYFTRSSSSRHENLWAKKKKKLSLAVLIIENVISYFPGSFLCFLLICPHRKNAGEKHRNQWLLRLWDFHGENSIRTHLDHLLYPANPPHSQACSVNSRACVFRVLSCKGAHLACRWGGEGAGGGKDGRDYGANVLQPEPQNCDPPRRALLEEKKKKIKSNGFSGIFFFSVHI